MYGGFYYYIYPNNKVNMRYYDTYEQETLSTLNTRTGVKKSRNYSSYWMDFDSDFDDAVTEVNPYSTERVVKLASVRRAVANFVRILTNNEKIQVKFSSGKDSYTDGKTVVIAAEDDSKHFDSMVGLALHEGSHCVLSDFNMLQHLIGPNTSDNCAMALKQEIRDSFLTRHNIHSTDIATKLVKTETLQPILGYIMNVIEDRRIDSYMYKNAVGYRPYYDAMYKKYFFNDEVTKNLKYNPDWRTPTVENYVNWLINIFHPNFDRDALPGLSKMVDMIDLKNIRRFDTDTKMSADADNWPRDKFDPTLYAYNELPLLWRTANDILYLMMQYVAKAELAKKQEGTGGDRVTIDIDGSSFEIDENGLENLDMNQSNSNPVPAKVKFNEKKVKDAMKKIKDVLQGKNRRKKLKSQEKRDIDVMESADAKIVEVGDKVVGKFPCLVLNNVTRQIMESNVFPFAYHGYAQKPNGYYDYSTTVLAKVPQHETAVVKGMQMGQILVHRLQVRNDPQVTHFTRQPHGKIDRRILAQLGMDIEQVFKRTTVENYRPAMLHLSLDASGSMQGKKWEQVISVATALAYVSSKIRNIEVVITIRGDREMPIVAVMYDSRKDRFQKARNMFPYLYPNGSTPEGLCFNATMDMITECANTYDVYFINFSDGEPGVSIRRKGEYVSYSGTGALQHTKRQVQLMLDAGVKILSYFIHDRDRFKNWNVSPNTHDSSSWRAFKTMYGEDAVNVNVENATEVIRTLNKLLLKKGD